MNMALGSKPISVKSLGWKTPVGTTLGYKHEPVTNLMSQIVGSPGIGLTPDQIIASGHYQFQPVGLVNPHKKHLNTKSGLEK